MKRRYSLDPNSGLLVDRDGLVLGRVVGLTLDDAPVGGSGGLPSLSSTAGAQEEPQGTNHTKGRGVGEPERRPTASQLEREAIERCWNYWLEISGKRQRLDTKRERHIRNALRLVGEDAVKQALLGLSRSPHHNGQNDQHREYLEVRYALKGLGDESDDERIEKAITWAALHAPRALQVDPEKLSRWLDDVRYHLEKQATGSLGGRERAVEAYRKLTGAGFQVERLSGAPWARVTR